MPDLDRIDFDILSALQNNARLSNKELAARVGLAPSSCLERVRRLRSEGVIRGFHAEIDPAAMGIGLEAMVSVRLQQHSLDLVEAFQEHLLALSEARAAYHIAGADDFLVHIAVRDVAHLRSVILEAFTTRAEVAHVETSLIFNHTRSRVLPAYPGRAEAAATG